MRQIWTQQVKQVLKQKSKDYFQKVNIGYFLDVKIKYSLMKCQNEEDGLDFLFCHFQINFYNEILIPPTRMDQPVLLITMPMY